MATYFASSSNQREGASMIYFRESLPGSYPEAPVPPGNVMMYMNSGSYSDALAASSQQQNNCIDIQSMEASDSTPQQQEIFSNLGGTQSGEHEFNAWRDNRNDMLVMHPIGGSTGMLHSGHNLQGQGLSLSLGTQIPSGIQMPSISYRNPNSGFASFLGSNSSISADGGRNGSSRDEQTRTTEYFPPGISGGNQDGKGDLSPYGMPCTARAIPSSKYLKAAQQLLDEVVKVRKDLKQPDGEKNQTTHEQQMKNSKDGDGGSKDASSNAQESASNTPNELSHAEIQELQNKLTKLLSMLDEVDRRYKHYYHQMQIVVSSFDVIAGCGAAKPYTALALQTISRHFRCLRDAICCQIRATRKSLGEQDNSDNSKGITRLRYVDQQLRQQRAIQQLGMMQQHAWRPQRGLPEGSVSILRAWLFEHFLHPYPKDSDKILLARQTGLTRSQVSNWFINARVRLWKPMVEEMYKEEFADEEMDSNSSSENAAKAIRGDMGTSEDRDEDLQQSGGSTATERCSSGQLTESKSGHIPDIEMTGASFQNGTGGEAETEYGLPKLREEQRLGFDDQNIFPNPMVPSDGSNDRFMAAAYHRHMSELGRFGSGSGVSLTLGLQHCEGGSLPMAGAAHQDFFSMGGDEIYQAQAAATSVGTDTVDYEYINNESRQPRFSSSHLLHDFIA